jgi:hypothetical protein
MNMPSLLPQRRGNSRYLSLLALFVLRKQSDQTLSRPVRSATWLGHTYIRPEQSQAQEQVPFALLAILQCNPAASATSKGKESSLSSIHRALPQRKVSWNLHKCCNLQASSMIRHHPSRGKQPGLGLATCLYCMHCAVCLWDWTGCDDIPA